MLTHENRWILYSAGFAFAINILCFLLIFLYVLRAITDIAQLIMTLITLVVGIPLYYYIKDESETAHPILYALITLLSHTIFSTLSTVIFTSIYEGFNMSAILYWTLIFLWAFMAFILIPDLAVNVFRYVKLKKQ